ncbi:MAG TPA: NAD(P)-dependent oxidoreductase [Puia sp.]|nr:NAD(P)-dependent oxidoreductase [Puia sp.]
MQHPPSAGKILITGASGFIGSALVEEALRKGYMVFAGLRKGSSKIFLQHPAIHFFEMDFSSPELLEQQFRQFNSAEGGFDIIIHNAGITRAHHKNDFYTVNCGYTKNFAHALTAAGSLPRQFVFISSLATYGPGDPSGREPIQLSSFQQPVSAYAKSKLEAEKFLQSLPALKTVIMRPTAVYGPRDKDFLSYFQIIKKGVEIKIGSGRQLLSFIYVRDLARIIFKILDEEHPQKAYLLSDTNNYRKDELGKMIRKALGKKALKITLPLSIVKPAVFGMEKIYGLFGRMPFIHSEKLSEISAPNWACDSKCTWEKYNVKPEHDLESGIQETAAWYRENGWL